MVQGKTFFANKHNIFCKSLMFLSFSVCHQLFLVCTSNTAFSHWVFANTEMFPSQYYIIVDRSSARTCNINITVRMFIQQRLYQLMSQESFSLSKSFQVNKGSGCATALQFHLPCQQPPHSHPRIPPLVPCPRLLRPRTCPLHPLLCPCPWRFPILALVVAEEFLSGFN